MESLPSEYITVAIADPGGSRSSGNRSSLTEAVLIVVFIGVLVDSILIRTRHKEEIGSSSVGLMTFLSHLD